MKKAFPVMKTCPLFAGIAESDYENLLAALSAKEDFFPKNETVKFPFTMKMPLWSV